MAADLLSSIRGELEKRLAELRPTLAEHERLLAAAAALQAGDSSGADSSDEGSDQDGVRASTRARRDRHGRHVASPSKTSSGRGRTRARARRSATEEAILAALEHGSHTVGELATVTGLGTANIRRGLGRLQKHRSVTRTRRAGHTAYALASEPPGG